MTATATFIRPAARRSSPLASPSRPLVGGGPTDRYRRAHRPVPSAGVTSRSATAARPDDVVRRWVVGCCAAIAVVLAVPVGGAVTSAVLSGSTASASAGSSASADVGASVPARHVAQPGDTLWSIAALHRGDVSHADYLDALIRLNGGTSIDVGQAVRLP